jgi:hypothetical protein
MGVAFPVVAILAVVVVVFLVFKLRGRVGASSPAGELQDPLLDAIADRYPDGPVRRGLLPPDHPGAIREILVFDAGDHWLFLFLGLRAVGQAYELSLRVAVQEGEDCPPQWPVEPATRVAGAIRDGVECAPGATWRLGALAAAMPRTAGVLALLDVEFGGLEPERVLQLVPITEQELAFGGDEKWALLERLYGDRARMTGAVL